MSQTGTEMTIYSTDRGEVQLSPAIIKTQLVPSGSKVTDQEVAMFLKLCQYQGLNPFLREVYLVKYGDSPAQMVTGKEVFTQRAFKDPRFAGFEAGITVSFKDQMIRREGTLLLPGEFLIGGWAKVYIKSYTVPMFNEVALSEYSSGQALWKTKPATMIRKVALVQSLREAFPDRFKGLYSQEEINSIDSSALPTDPIPTQFYTPAALTPPAPEAPADAKTVQDAPAATAPAQSQPTETRDLAPIVLKYGKHKDKTMLQAYQDDPGYFTFMAENNKSETTRKMFVDAMAQFDNIPAPKLDDGRMPTEPDDMSDLPFTLD